MRPDGSRSGVSICLLSPHRFLERWERFELHSLGALLLTNLATKGFLRNPLPYFLASVCWKIDKPAARLRFRLNDPCNLPVCFDPFPRSWQLKLHWRHVISS